MKQTFNKSRMKTRVYLLLLGISFLMGTDLSAQVEIELKPKKSKVLSSKTLDKSFIQLINENDEVKSLVDHLNKKGFFAQRNSKNFYGVAETYRDVISKKQVRYKFQFQDYINPDTKDLVALCHLSATSGKEIETYTFYLLAPGGNFDQMEEYMIDKRLNVQRANSWWSCTKKRVSKKCSGECVSAFITCVPAGASSVVGYLVCVAGNCTGCLIKAGACCACDCRWYCKWATGCCDK